MEKKFKNFMPVNAIKICIDLCETDLHRDRKIRAELFTQLCRLAKYRHVRIIWHGNDDVVRQPDKFTFVKNGRAYLFNIDGIRYDGMNARCIHDDGYFG